MLSSSLNAFFSHLGVFLFSVKPSTTENTENKTTPKICKITVFMILAFRKPAKASLFYVWKRITVHCNPGKK